MKKIIPKIFLFSLIFFNSFLTLQAQQDEWVRVYGDDIHNVIRGLIETYDGGYLIGGHIKPPDGQFIKDGLLIKTDINGEILSGKSG